MATYLKDTINYIGSIKLQKLRNSAIGLRKIRIAIDKNRQNTKITKENLKKINKSLSSNNRDSLTGSLLGTISTLKQDVRELSQSLELLQAKEQDLLTSVKGTLDKNNKKRILSKKKMIKAVKYRKSIRNN